MSKTANRSKYLSLILRHDPAKIGIILDSAGWANVDQLLSALKWSRYDLVQIVENDNKKRYEFDSTGTKIRASQGHSIDVDLGYEIQEPPKLLYHGTSLNNLNNIKLHGILKMDRHDVHMFDSIINASKIAIQRRSNPIVIYICAKDMFRDGYIFKKSTNNVWLTDTVPSKYLGEIICY